MSNRLVLSPPWSNSAEPSSHRSTKQRLSLWGSEAELRVWTVDHVLSVHLHSAHPFYNRQEQGLERLSNLSV